MIDTNKLEELQQENERLRHRNKLIEHECMSLDRSHEAIGHQLASVGAELSHLRLAVRALLTDIQLRHPGEELQCPHLRRLDEMIHAESRKTFVTNTKRAV